MELISESWFMTKRREPR